MKKISLAILTALANLAEKTSDLNLNLPPHIIFIKGDDSNMAGLAYTREDYIVLTPDIFEKDTLSINSLVAHEVFHIYSRYNNEDRPELYGIISFNECENLVYPDEIRDLKMTNPDAPLNNYYIECEFGGENFNFIPIIFRQRPFYIDVDTNIFETMRDPMLAVEIVNGKPEPIYRNGQLFLVAKSQLTDFYTKIGKNTNYTLHPEEMLADNFAKYITDQDLPSPWVVEELLDAMKND